MKNDEVKVRKVRNIALMSTKRNPMREVGVNAFVTPKTDVEDWMVEAAMMDEEVQVAAFEEMGLLRLNESVNHGMKELDYYSSEESVMSTWTEEEYFAMWDKMDPRGLFRNGELTFRHKMRIREEYHECQFIKDTAAELNDRYLEKQKAIKILDEMMGKAEAERKATETENEELIKAREEAEQRKREEDERIERHKEFMRQRRKEVIEENRKIREQEAREREEFEKMMANARKLGEKMREEDKRVEKDALERLRNDAAFKKLMSFVNK